MKNILLVDDHHLVRAGLRALITSMHDYTVAAEASDGNEVIELLDKLDIDLLMTDLSMKGLSGIDLIPQVRARFPQLPILVLSMHASKDIVMRALKAGASGYLVKDAAEAELELALNAIFEGQQYLSPRISQQVIAAMMAPQDQPDTAKSKLTPRQTEILRLIAEGKATKEIAYDLDLSAKTVESHRAQIMERLGIRDVAGLVRYAIKHDIISLD